MDVAIKRVREGRLPNDDFALGNEVGHPGLDAMSDGAPPIPSKLGRYEVLCSLGQGGMATLYLARAKGVDGRNRLFAIKLIHEHLSREKGFVQMFLDEARLATRILHPNVVAAHEVGAEGGRQFIVLDYVNGETLAFAIMMLSRSKKRFPIELAANITIEVARGLHAAHELTDEFGDKLGVVHRDVAPHNILVGYDGSVRLTDFGIAKAKDRISHTDPGMLKGRLAYMAPEHVRQSARPDRRVDVFSLGVVFWESLAGRRLFRGKNDLETTERLLRSPIPSPRSIRSDCPASVEQVALKALERDPDLRYGSALEFAKALEAAIGPRPGLSKELSKFLKECFRERYDERQSLQKEALSAEMPSLAPPARLDAGGDFEDEGPISSSERIPELASARAVLGSATPKSDPGLPEPITDAALDLLDPPKSGRESDETSQPPKQEEVGAPIGESSEDEPTDESAATMVAEKRVRGRSQDQTSEEIPLTRPVFDLEEDNGKTESAPAPSLEDKGSSATKDSPELKSAQEGKSASPKKSQRFVPTTVIRTRSVIDEVNKERNRPIVIADPTDQRSLADELSEAEIADLVSPGRRYVLPAVAGVLAAGLAVALFVWSEDEPPAPASMLAAAPDPTPAKAPLPDVGPGALDAEAPPEKVAEAPVVPPPEPSDPVPPPKETVLPKAAEPPSPAKEVALPPPKPPAEARPPREAKKFEVVFDVRPKDATIIVDGEPSEAVVMRKKGTMAVEVSAPGYKSFSKRLTISKSKTFKIALAQVREPPEPRKTLPKVEVSKKPKPMEEPPKKKETTPDPLLLIEGGDL